MPEQSEGMRIRHPAEVYHAVTAPECFAGALLLLHQASWPAAAKDEMRHLNVFALHDLHACPFPTSICTMIIQPNV